MTLSRRQLLQASLIAGLWRPAELAAQSLVTADVIAETTMGRIRGVAVDGVNIFKGVPYAGNVDGPGRFLPPPPAERWTGLRDCTKTGARAIQAPGVLFMNPLIGEYFSGGRSDRAKVAEQTESENCLGLNVLTPGLTGRRAVMVYIHGGGFTGGSNVLTAFSDRFVRENDVVLVGVNHRLNMFGYLYLGAFSEKYADSGNVGQLDLVAALRWVRDNILRFGGDPGNVTIFGESGGGAKVSALLAMQSAKGLFHRAIVESGSPLSATTTDAATRSAKAALDTLGLTAEQLDQLHTMPLEKLRTAGGGSGAVMDGRSVPLQTWTPGAPATAAGIPMIIGNCKDESTLFSRQTPDLFSLDMSGLRERVVEGGVPASAVDELIACYQRDYPSDSPSDIYFRISTDRGARMNAISQAERKVAQGSGAVYMYYFAWNTPIADGKMAIKAFHTAELPLAMRLTRYPETEPLSRQIAGAWAAFAKTGRPTHAALPDWPAYDITRRATMVFDLPSHVVNDPNRDERVAITKFPSGRLL